MSVTDPVLPPARSEVPVLRVQRAGARFVTEAAGIATRHAFSFGAHYDPDNVGFATLIAHNDEQLSSGRGFDDHPHRDTEIVTWVLSGSLLHQDSTGQAGIIAPGFVQRLSAGSGVVHAERNDAYRLDPDRPRVPLRFVQSWLRPDAAGVAPAYAQGAVERVALDADWVPVASGSADDAAISLGSAASTLWVTGVRPGESRSLPEAACAHLFVAVGEIEVERAGVLTEGDALRVTGRAALRITGRQPSELMVWGMG